MRAALSRLVWSALVCGALAASAEEPPPAARPPAAPAAQTADEALETRVRTLEEQVVDLKERVFRSKARLLLLQESVLGGNVSAGSRALLVHRNEMSQAFALESVAYALDGSPIFAKTDKDGDLAGREELELFNGRIVPGEHQIAVRMVYRGSGFGVFSYLEGYKFRLQYTCTFNAEPGRTATVRIVGFEKGDLTTDVKERPAVECRVDVSRDGARGPAALPAAGTVPGGPATVPASGTSPAAPSPAPAN